MTRALVLLLALCACAGPGEFERECFAPDNAALPFCNAVRVGATVYIAGHLGPR